jgi:FAD/FMN-containing dehydrogenase
MRERIGTASGGAMDLVAQMRELLGEGAVLGPGEAAERAAGVWRADSITAAALVRPRSTSEVSAVLRFCHEHGIEVVTHGGLTGLVHGADAAANQLVLSLERMRAIEDIDAVQRTATVEAGVTLQALQEAVEERGLAFPLDFGARGRATLGGNAATNAGGNRVIRYGMMRDMVLGLEVVLPDGQVVCAMNHLIKNNTGYDLKQLFIGSEGTLGVITRLVLRLRENPLTRNMALVAVDEFAAVASLLKHMDRGLGGTLSAFEVLWQDFYRLVSTPPAPGRAPLEQTHAFYVLMEAQGAAPEADPGRFQAVLETAFDEGLIADAAISQSESDCGDFWALRDDVEQTFRYGVPVVFDVSLPIAAMDDYTAAIRAALSDALPGSHCWIFGHLGDGNLHVIVQTAAGDAPAHRGRIEEIVYRPLAQIGGSVSAEHGIGLEKKPYLSISRSVPELALMRTIKRALDPRGILNPGKIFD